MTMNGESRSFPVARPRRSLIHYKNFEALEEETGAVDK